MAGKRYLRCGAAGWLAVLGLTAAEHHGQVKFGGLPLPGATVSTTQGDKKFLAITDQQGAYSFPSLPDGTWTIQVEMLCFFPMKQEVAVAPDVPGSEWNMKLLPLDEIKAAAAPTAPPVTEQPVAPPVTALPSSKAGKQAKAQRKQPQPAAAQPGFQRTDLNATGDAAKAEDETGGIVAGDLSRSASDVFAINGSVNNGAASPFAQSQAFGNNRRAGRSLWGLAVSVVGATRCLAGGVRRADGGHRRVPWRHRGRPGPA